MSSINVTPQQCDELEALLASVFRDPPVCEFVNGKTTLIIVRKNDFLLQIHAEMGEETDERGVNLYPVYVLVEGSSETQPADDRSFYEVATEVARQYAAFTLARTVDIRLG